MFLYLVHCIKSKDSSGLLHKVSVCVTKATLTQSNWKTLTLPRTGGQTTFLLRSERPFSHYAAALIYRNTKIQLNGAIFSFAFGGHFSCLENSSHSFCTRGSIVIIARSVRVQRPGSAQPGGRSRTTAGTHSAQHTQLCSNGPTANRRQGRLLSHGLIDNGGRFQQWLLSAWAHLWLGKPCKKH